MADRRQRRPALAQLRALSPLVVVWATGVSVLAVVATQQRVPDSLLLLDPVSANGLPWYTGLVSDLGVLVWCVASCVAATSAYVAWLDGRPRAARFLIEGSLVGALLMADDLLLLHSDVIPRHLGVPKRGVELAEVAIVAVWLAANRVELTRTRYQLLVAAGVAFAASLLIDAMADGRSVRALVAEDGAKLLGIQAWATYFVATARDILRSVVAAGREERPQHQLPSGA